MKKSVMGIVAVVVVIAGAAGAYALMRHNNDKNNMNSMNMTSNTNSTTPADSSSVATSANSVTIQNFAFGPSSITVKKGTKVTWTNKDNVTHTINESDGQGSGPNSGDLSPGASYSFTFTAVGTFNYHCAIHPSMLGKVIVTE